MIAVALAATGFAALGRPSFLLASAGYTAMASLLVAASLLAIGPIRPSKRLDLGSL